jgi:hypothetical protein
MSTNGTSPSPGSPSVVQESRGIKLPERSEDVVIKPGELGAPVELLPWQAFSFDDPDLIEYNREVPFEELHKMLRRDGQMRMLFNIFQWPMRAAKFSIEPTDGGEDEADFIRDMLTKSPQQGGMVTTMSYIMSSLSLAYVYGFSVFEKVIEEIDGRQVLRKLSPRPARSVTFRYDDHGGLNGIVQRIWRRGQHMRIPIPPEKLFLWTVGKEHEPLQGESLFLPAYYHYDKKHRLYYIAHIAAQVGAVPLMVGKVPAGQDKAILEYFKDMLASIGLQGALAIPVGWEVESHSAQSNVLDQIVKLIEHHDVQASKSMLAHFANVATEGKGGLGTATTTSELGDLFTIGIETNLRDVAEHFTNYLIPYFIDVNFGSGKYPVFHFEPFTDEQKTVMKETFMTLYNATSPPAPEVMFEVMREFAENLGLEGIDWDELKTRLEEEQKRRDEMDAVAHDTQKAQMEQAQKAAKLPPGEGAGGPGAGGGTKPPAGIGAGGTSSGKSPAARLSETVRVTEVGRAVEAAERAIAAGAAIAVDAYGNPFTVGAHVVMLDEEEEGPLWAVKDFIGGMVLVSPVGDDSVTEQRLPDSVIFAY